MLFLDKVGYIHPNLLLFKLTLLITTISFLYVLIKERGRFSLIYFLLTLFMGSMAFSAIRNFTLYALFTLPILCFNLKNLFDHKNKIIITSLIVYFLFFFNNFLYLDFHPKTFGLGLMAGNNQTAEFFKKEKLHGPIFNNYDIGGYLIFHLFPQEKVFVDNRPEFYSPSFF